MSDGVSDGEVVADGAVGGVDVGVQGAQGVVPGVQVNVHWMEVWAKTFVLLAPPGGHLKNYY